MVTLVSFRVPAASVGSVTVSTGALVSKTEDISKAISGLMLVIMVVYMLSLTQLSNVDGIIIKVLSFLPVSSYSAMFARIAMGSVSMVEVIISGVILIISIIGAGWIGALIYRMGTLRYGNPIKVTNLLKEMKINLNTPTFNVKCLGLSNNCGSSITAAAKTLPANGPRPASSQPASMTFSMYDAFSICLSAH